MLEAFPISAFDGLEKNSIGLIIFSIALFCVFQKHTNCEEKVREWRRPPGTQSPLGRFHQLQLAMDISLRCYF